MVIQILTVKGSARITTVSAPHQLPNTTACMMRPGARVKRPAITSAPTKIATMARRCRSTRWRLACMGQWKHRQREDREQMDRAPRIPDPQIVDEERTHRHDHHERDPDPPGCAVR